MQTGLVLCVPEAQAIVGRTRAKHDSAARAGMPPHVTLIYPFMDSRAFDDRARAKLAALCAATSPLSFDLGGFGRFDNVLWLAPSPAEPIVALVRHLEQAFPGHPSFGGAFPEIVPHLTVAHGDPAAFRAIERGLASKLAKPISVTARTVTLFGLSDQGWIPLEAFDLAG